MGPPQSPTLPPPSQRLAAIEAMDDVIIGVDPELRITTWNDAAARLHDRDAMSVLGKPLMHIIAPEARADAVLRFERALTGEPIPRHETVFLRPDGTGVPLSIAVAAVGDGSGKLAGLVILGRDGIAQQRLQMQLLQSKRMESAGHLAGGIAHEFNNILTAILALTDFAAREIGPDAPARDDLEEIRQQATKGARLVRHLLAFSRRQLLRTEVVQLGAIFQELEPLLQRLVSERVLIAADISNDSRPVEVDRAQIELVLLELISNASDAMENGGTLSIAVRPITIAKGPASNGMPPGVYAQLTVQDTGTGVDPAIANRLLEPFFTTKGEAHPGLGLAMVDRVIQQHGGSVTLASHPGQGTVVRILLPASGQMAPPEADYSPAQAGDQGGNETILVVEDETSVRMVICRSLRDRGYHVIEAKNGEDALLVAERHNAPIHLVVTDVVMPEMGGADLFRHLRRWYPTMRILFISGYTKGAIPPEALEEGSGSGFLPKPFSLDQLANEVRRVIGLPRPTASPLP